MLQPNPYVHVEMTRFRLQDSLDRAETDRICREAGIDQRGFTARLACRSLAALGSLFVSFGGSLQRLGPVPGQGQAQMTRLPEAR